MIYYAYCLIFRIVSFVILYWLFRYVIIPIVTTIIKFYWIKNFHNNHNFIKSSGKWVVLTGATDGIGLEYCRQFAKIGLNIFLVSRDKEKLKLICKELKQYYKVEVDYFQADFTTKDFYGDLKNILNDLDIGVLVNNVGMTQPFPSYFHEVDDNFSLSNMINCNILSAISMTKIVSIGMCKRKRGIILNISSASSILPMPMSAIYSSTKSFLTQFSRTISEEMSNCGIYVQTVLPFFVQTKFIGKFRPPRCLTPTAEEYVETAIKTIGCEKETFGTLNHSIQGILTSSVSRIIGIKSAKIIHHMRRRALLKAN